MKNYMLDTVIFNRIKDGNINVSNFAKANFFITHIQPDEIEATPDSERRDALKNVFKNIIQIKLPSESFLLGTSLLDSSKMVDPIIKTESAVYGISKYEKAKYPSATDQYDYFFLKSALDTKRRHKNNKKDALIAETAIKNNLILVTDDRPLFEVMTEIGCRVQDFAQFVADCAACKLG